jgi:outer membrane protein
MKLAFLARLTLVAALSGTAAAQPGAQPAQPPAPPPATSPPSAPTPTPPSAPAPEAPATTGPVVLTLERALELAMRLQPSLRQSKAQLEAANGRADLARVVRRPTVGLSASLNAGSTQPRPCADDPTRTCGGFFDPTASTGLAAQANWRIYDFGLTAANIRAAELGAEAVAAQVTTTTLDIRTEVEIAYLEAVARRRLIQVAEATVRSEDAHLDQARRFVAAQAKDPIEVAQAQARDANAKSALAQAQSNEAIALANLRSAIGWVEASNSPTVSLSWPTPADNQPPPLTALVEVARKNRSEIIQLDKELAAAEADLDAAVAGRRPVLAATAGTQWSPDTNDASPEPTWNAGLTLSWQLFDGGRAAADARIARANVQSAIAQREALLVLLTSQLDLARAQIIANRANVQASTEAVAAARAQLQLAEARYRQGLGSQIELADAQTAVTTAEGNLVQAEFQLASAWAQLRRATAQ